MIYMVIAMGIVISVFLFGIILTLFSPNGSSLTELGMIQTYASISSYILGFTLSFIFVKIVSLKKRMPNKLPARYILIIGVWLSILHFLSNPWLLIAIGLRDIVHIFLIYFGFLAPVMEILGLGIIKMLASLMILYSLFIIFLESKPQYTMQDE